MLCSVHLQAFTRAVELDGTRLYSKVQCGNIHLSLGVYLEALTSFEAALEQSPDFGPACEGAGSALLASARSHQSFGAPGLPFRGSWRKNFSSRLSCHLSRRLVRSWIVKSSAMIMCFNECLRVQA